MRVGGVLPYYIEAEPGESGMTALAGLSPYLDLMRVVKLRESVEAAHPPAREWSGLDCSSVGDAAVLLNHRRRATAWTIWTGSTRMQASVRWCVTWNAPA
jgi:hypothetical protein